MKSPESAPRSVSLFYSYSHKDEALRDELEEHLSILKRHGIIHSWHDRKIGAGHEWQSSIDKNLETANIIVFLVSSAFLASDYCYDKEIKKALEKHEKGDARTIPVIIRPVDWSGAPFSKLQALPKNAEAVTSWANRDEAWTDVAKGIRKVIEELILSNTKGQVTQSQVQVETVQKVKEDQLEHDEKPVIPKPKLRSQPIEDLAVDEVKIMLKEKGFFHSRWNESATGFPNNYELQHDGKVVFDKASGLMWQQSGSDKCINYKKAKSYIIALNRQSFAGYSDWRLPTLGEAMSLMEPKKNSDNLYIDSRFNSKQKWIWTSDLESDWSAWVVYFYFGYCILNVFINITYVRAVR